MSVDARLAEMLEQVKRGSSPDDWADIGRRCREITIAAGNVVFNSALVPTGEPVPGDADGEERIGYYVDFVLAGRSNAPLRGLVRKLFVLANAVTHERSPTRVMAFASAQATVSLVRILQAADESIPF